MALLQKRQKEIITVYMTVLLVDDNSLELENLASFIQEWNTQRTDTAKSENPLRLCICSSAKETLTVLKTLKNEVYPNAAILDIVMPETKGTELAIELRKKNFTGPIVFLTSSNEFACESYEVHAFSYLLKPINKKKLFSVLSSIEDHLQQKKERKIDEASILLSSKSWKEKVLFSHLMWVEVKSHYLYFHIKNEEGQKVLKTGGSLSATGEVLLQDERFASCHSSFIVNMDYVQTVANNEAIIHTGEKLPISRRHSEFKSLYVDYVLKKARRYL